MKAIFIPQLVQKANHTESLEFAEFLDGLETLTPVRGQLTVTHQGNYLEVAVQGETIITLTCDRCLKQYNHRLVVNTSELIWLEPGSNYHAHTDELEVEVPLENLVESLSPDGYFPAQEWLYEQMCLALPMRQLCDRNCPGIPIKQEEATLIDARWSALAALKSLSEN